VESITGDAIRRHRSGDITAGGWIFYFDHLSAEIGKVERHKGTGAELLDRENPDSGERKLLHYLMGLRVLWHQNTPAQHQHVFLALIVAVRFEVDDPAVVLRAGFSLVEDDAARINRVAVKNGREMFHRSIFEIRNGTTAHIGDGQSHNNTEDQRAD